MCRWLSGVMVVASMAFLAQSTGLSQDSPPEKAPSGSQPASQPSAVSPTVKPPQAQIYEQLLRDTDRVREPLSSVEPGRVGDGGRPDMQDESLMLDGTPLHQRAGRVVRAGDRTEFHFLASPGSKGASKVMEFNKNGLLEAMEREAEAGVSQFVISAEVTRYRGRNYLNLLNYRRKIDHGNLSP